ncbi:MAG: aspartate/glutamate racemase family protein [Candidatus Solibacter sp.]
MRRLGLIGGLGPGATVHYYEQLSRLGAGEFLLIQADMAHALSHVQRGDTAGLAAYFARLIQRLADGGAEVAAISAVTPHICIRELAPISPLPLVSIVDEIGAAIRASGYRRVALFGTRFTVESGMFGMLAGCGAEIVLPSPEQIAEIHQAYMQTVEGGSQGLAPLTRLAHELPVDGIVLAGTDLALIYNESNIDFPCIDGAQVHVQAILRELQSTAPAAAKSS